MLTADKIQDMKEYLNYAFETMLKLWRTVDYSECVHEAVIACDGKVVDSGQLSFEADENGEIEPVLLRDNKCIMHDVEVLDALAQC
jgi:hypothetical protein